MVKVSIIMPAYKTEETISFSIQSIINQTFSDWELIIVDDGSPDRVVSIAREWGERDQRIRIYQQANKGVASARNYGLEKSRGEYIAFLDSDDIWSSQFMETMLNCIESRNLDFVYSGFFKGVVQKKMNPTGRPYVEKEILQAYTSGRQTIWLCATMASRSILQDYQIKFFEGTRYMEDVEFLIKILVHANTSAGVVKQELASYCRRENSATGKKWTRNQEDMVIALGRAAEYVGQNYGEKDCRNIVDEILKNQSTRLVRFLWGAILENEKELVRDILKKYSQVLDYPKRKFGHSVKTFFVKTPFFWDVVRLLYKEKE